MQPREPFFKSLYFRVLVAIALGALLGHLRPAWGQALQPLGEGFVRLIKMLIAPIVFATVVVGIASMGDMKKVGRVGAKALLYFEVVSTIALFIGLLVVKLVQPGAGIHADPARLDAGRLASYTHSAQHLSTVEFLLNIIPANVVGAFAQGEILQVLLFAVLFGVAVAGLGEAGRSLVDLCDRLAHALFGIVALIMKLAPLGAFGAMAFTVGQFGIRTLLSLGKLMAAFYLTSVLFVVLVLGTIVRVVGGFGIGRLLGFIKDEIFIVLGTSSSESVLPRMIQKLEQLGCSRTVVGLVIPTGYSFNLDGTSIYLTMAAIFVAQATGTHLTLGQELSILMVLMLTSKGAAAVTGGGFITLAATLSSTGSIPVAGLTLLLGVDRFMSEARAITNLIGNAVATVVVAKWEGEFDQAQARRVLGEGVARAAPAAPDVSAP